MNARWLPTICLPLLLTTAVGFTCMALSSPRPARAAWIPDGVPLCTDPNDQLGPLIVSDGARGAIVAWVDSPLAFEPIVFAQRVDSTGATLWTDCGVPVSRSQSDQIAIAPALGGAVICWRQVPSSIYAQRLDGSGAAQWGTFGAVVSDPNPLHVYVFGAPAVIGDGAGGANTPGWIMAYRRAQGAHIVAVCARHVDEGGTQTWGLPETGGLTIGIASGTTTGGPVLALDGVGSAFARKGVVAAWSLNDGSPTDDIFAQRVNSSGVVQWTADSGVAVCTATGVQNHPRIVNVGAGNVIIAWQDSRTSDQDLYAQKLNSLGLAQWAPDGLPICRASTAQTNLELVSDNAGGVIAVWEDARSGATRVYAQRVNGSGTALWPTDGVEVCSEPSPEIDPAIVADQQGGAIIAWEDYRVGEADLYAQRLDANGNLLWPATGVALSNATGLQSLPRLASDGEFGAIAAWVDYRSTSADIYARRVYSGGTLGVTPNAPMRARLAFASANPSQGRVRLTLELPQPVEVRVEVLDAVGRRVRMLGSGEELAAGAHPIDWDGKDATGRPARPGLFFVCVHAGSEELVSRVARLH